MEVVGVGPIGAKPGSNGSCEPRLKGAILNPRGNVVRGLLNGQGGARPGAVSCRFFAA
jgi:hypothetical protein